MTALYKNVRNFLLVISLGYLVGLSAGFGLIHAAEISGIVVGIAYDKDADND